jgi:DNA-binding beta-propeller fold protein YncE
MKKTSYIALSLAICVACSLSVKAQTAEPLRAVRTIQLSPSVKGPFDHLAIDVTRNRLFLTPEDYKAVLVIDLTTGKVIHEITGIGRPHAVFYRPDLNRIYVTDGTDGALKTFDGATYAPLHSAALAKDADSIGYDVSRQLLYVANGGKDEGQKFSFLSIVDTKSGKKLSDIKIDGETLEAMALDIYRPRLYINNKAKNQIEVLDRLKGTVVASWPVTLCTGNVAIGLDEPHQRLFAACRSGKISVFDTNTGKELQALAIGTGVDDMVYDPGSKRIYAAGNGVVNVVEETDADHYVALGAVKSGPGAKTALLVPALNRYFVAVPQHDSQNAAVIEMETLGTPALKPASAEIPLTVDAPAAEQLILSTLSAHPSLRKMGLHAIPPNQHDSVIIANGNATRIGFRSSKGDFEAIGSGKTSCVKRDDGSYYNIKMPMMDAAGRRIGFLVMEIPYTSARDEAEATHQAEELRAELARQIPSHASLFQYSLNVSAPLAQKLTDDAMSANKGLQKIGLHVTPPGSPDNVIIAANIADKIGKKSSDADMSVARSGKPTVARVNGPSPFYDLALPLQDATGKGIGMIVMELRGDAAKDESDALRKAEAITTAIQKQIPGSAALFGPA